MQLCGDAAYSPPCISCCMMAAAAAATPALEGEPFIQWEGGIADVDMGCGLLNVTHIHRISHLWMMSGHRGYCNHDVVRPWLQVAFGPALLFLPRSFERKKDLRDVRAAIVAQLGMFGHLVRPYESKQESVTRPQTVIADAIVVSAWDLSVILKFLGWDEVCGCVQLGVKLDV